MLCKRSSEWPTWPSRSWRVRQRPASNGPGRTGEPLEEALKAVLKTKAGQQLMGLRDGPHRDEEAKRWHDELAPKRAKKRREARREESSKLASLAQPDAACEHFIRQATLRKEGPLAGRRQTPGRYE